MLENTFAQHRWILTVKSAAVREAASKLNRALAVALADGLKTGPLSAASLLPRKEVAQAAMAFDDLHPQGIPAQVHVSTVEGLGRELAALKQTKAAAEADQLALMAATRRQRILDDFELARLTGLRHEHIRRLTWGVTNHSTSTARP